MRGSVDGVMDGDCGNHMKGKRLRGLSMTGRDTNWLSDSFLHLFSLKYVMMASAMSTILTASAE